MTVTHPEVRVVQSFTVDVGHIWRHGVEHLKGFDIILSVGVPNWRCILQDRAYNSSITCCFDLSRAFFEVPSQET